MTRLLCICAGGAAGTCARYLIGLWATRTFGIAFPWGTLIVNVAGSLLIGAVLTYAAATRMNETLALTLTTGFMGGFTTYSSFNEETLRFATAGSWRSAGGYVSITLVVCWIAGMLGRTLAR